MGRHECSRLSQAGSRSRAASARFSSGSYALRGRTRFGQPCAQYIFCANALETALQLRERSGGKITALSFGAPTAEEVLRKALALNVDEAVLVVNENATRPNPLTVAQTLAAAIKQRGDVDLVLVGRESWH